MSIAKTYLPYCRVATTDLVYGAVGDCVLVTVGFSVVGVSVDGSSVGIMRTVGTGLVRLSAVGLLAVGAKVGPAGVTMGAPVGLECVGWEVVGGEVEGLELGAPGVTEGTPVLGNALLVVGAELGVSR